MTVRPRHAEGRHERGAARLGHQRRRHLSTCIGTAAGPHPYPEMVRDFQSVIGREAREQMLEAGGPPARRAGRLRSAAAPTPSACSIPSSTTARRDLSASRRRPRPRRRRALRLAHRRPPGRAARQPHLSAAGRRRPDPRGHSISAGLDYPGVGPEHAWLNDIGRVEYVPITDDEALEAFQLLPQARRHHPGARAGPRARPGDRSSRRRCGKDQTHGHEPVRPRRQGHLHRRRASRAWRSDHDHPHRRAASPR